MRDDQSKPTAYRDYVTVSDAAKTLGVSIDTIRRWDKAGKLHSSRLDGKNRYFAVDELEQTKASLPLSMTQTAALLGVSASTVRRLEQTGELTPVRSSNGRRSYEQNTIQEYVEAHTLAKLPVKEKAKIPTAHVAVTAAAVQQGFHKQEKIQPHAKLSAVKHKTRRAFVYAATAAFCLTALLFLAFLVFPSRASQIVGVNSLATSGTDDQRQQTSWWERMIKPFSDGALYAVSVVSPGTLEEVTKAQSVDYSDSDTVDGREPGDGPGNIALLPLSGNNIVDQSINSDKLTDGSVELQDLSADVVTVLNRIGSRGPQGPEGPAGPAGSSSGSGGSITSVLSGAGLTGGGTSGDLTLSVLFGSSAGTIAAGSNTFICSSGSGNLTGGGTTVTLGTTGTTCANITTNSAVSFATSVASPLFTNAGNLTISSTGAGNDITLTSADEIILTGFDCSANANGGVLTVNPSGILACEDDNSAAAGTVTGTGTTGRLSVFSSTSGITDSWLIQNGSTLQLDNTRNLQLLGGTVTATTFIGAVTGNASTASALAANPTDCSASQFAVSIVSSGNLTCAALTDADIPNTITIDTATTASTSTAFVSNPTDCSANQFATTIAANGNLTCAALTDGDVPDSITVTLASTATALASNPTDCSANQFATAIVASGNLTCASITDADVSNTLTASILVGTGSTSNAVDLATAEVAGNLPASRLQSAAADLGAANVTVDFSNTNGAFNTNITTDGTITASSFIGAITGNASTATALAANPTDCSANQFANAIAANGNLTCANLADGDVPNTITIDLATAATTLQSNPTDCSANQFANAIAASGNLNCASLIDADIPNTISIDLATTATALASNPTDCSASQFAISIVANGNLSCASLTDGDVPNSVTIDNATSAGTATALVANPSDCSASQFATSIAANGNLSCASLTDGDIPNSVTIDLATAATSLQSNPTDCSANQFANAIATNGNLTCAALTDGDIPNTITVDNATAAGTATTASALASNPTDCAASQFANAIVANGNLTCAALVDGDIPDSITISLAATATALAANPTDCSANQFANAIVASGNLTCSDVTLGTQTSGDYVASFTAGDGLTGGASGEGSTPTLAVVSANGGIVANADNITLTIQTSTNALSSTTSSGSGLEVLAGGLSLLQGCADSEVLKWNETTDVWACATDATGGVTDGDKGDITVSGSGTSWNIDADSIALGTDTTGNYVATVTAGNGISGSSSTEAGTPTIALGDLTADWVQAGSFDISTAGDITATTFIGALTGNASTATTLASNPSDCSANQLANAIAASGNLTCASLVDGDIPNTITIDLATTATALAANPTDCSVNQFAVSIVASGNLTCASLTDGDIPDSITVDNATSAGTATTASALASNPTDCGANQFATTIAANGNLTCASLTDGDIPNSITIDLSTTATALASNPTDCGANQFATTIAASGNLTCASITDADVSNTLTSSIFIGSGSTTDGIDLATAEVSGGLRASNLQSAAADLGAANVTVDFSNTNGAFNTNITTDGSITASSLIGALTGNASTATALASNPSDCSASQFATTIAANGNLTCAALTDGDVPNSITIDLASTATALAANPSDCSANQFATTIAASGDLSCAALTDGDIPNTITIDTATSATTAGALSANPSDCSANQFATTIAADGNLTCASITDADVSDTLTASLFVGSGSSTTAIDLATAEVAGNLRASNLQSAAADLGAANITINLSNTNGAFNTNLTLDGTLTAGSITGTLTGNASTATALAANPSDCSANQFANAIVANGNLTCASLTDGDVPDSITVDLATAATALSANPSDCSANQFATTIAANGNLTCASLTDGDIPNTITIDLATSASSAVALASNPSDCSANQFATTIAANGNLTCASLTDGDIPNNITVDLAAAANALSSNPSDCSANQFASAIAANGDLSCAGITDADVSDTLTASIFVGSGSSSNAVDLATAEVAGNLLATNLQGAASDLGAANVDIILSNTNGAFVTNLTLDGTVTAASIVGALTGNASTATALAANPTDCSANQFANAIAASGNLTCAALTDGDIPNTITVDLAAAATALASNPSDCGANQFATTIAASGNLTCASLTDGDIPDSITVTLATTATALAANPTDCAANQFANAIAASGNLTCAALTDGDIPDSITVTLASTATALAANPSDCGVNSFATTIAASGNLTCAALTASNLPSAAADLGAANVDIVLSNTNGSFVTNLTTDGTITAATFAGALSGNASTAAALASNPSDCSANQFANAIVASGNLTCAALTDGDIPNSITIDLAASATALAANPADCSAGQFATTIAASGALTCAAILATNLPVAAADLGAANVNLNFGNTNGAFNTNLTLDGTITAGSGLTVSAGGIAVTGNSTIAGTLSSLTGLTLSSGAITTSNLGIEFTDSDTNPSCAAGNYNIYADTSETKLKKCVNGVVSDLQDPIIRSFEDSGTTAYADNDTTNYFGGTAPNITPTVNTNEVMVVVHIPFVSSSSTDFHLSFRVLRHTSAITCQTTGTAIQVMGGVSGLSGAHSNFSATFMDSPATTSNVQYTVCSEADGEAATGTVGLIQISLFEINDAADLAEVYPTNDASLNAGEVVTMDPSLSNGIRRSTKAYDASAIGIVSTKPALAIGGRGGEGVDGKPIALSGRVPVKVSTINGVIRRGDLLTSSNIPGVAMKATKSGAALGVAMGDYDGTGVGQVMVFVQQGQSLGQLPPDTEGAVFDSSTFLGELVNGQLELAADVDLSSIYTDRLAAAVEIVTPRVVTQDILTKNLIIGEEGLNFVGTNGEVVLSIDQTGLVQSTSQAQPSVLNQTTPTIDLQNLQVGALEVDLDLLVGGGLVVEGEAEFRGATLFDQLVTFGDSILVKGDATFEGNVTFNNNTAGYAKFNPGQQTVHISFSQPFTTKPVITLSLGNGAFAQYSYTNVTSTGFDIVLSEPASETLELSWSAIQVSNPVTFVSQ